MVAFGYTWLPIITICSYKSGGGVLSSMKFNGFLLQLSKTLPIIISSTQKEKVITIQNFYDMSFLIISKPHWILQYDYQFIIHAKIVKFVKLIIFNASKTIDHIFSNVFWEQKQSPEALRCLWLYLKFIQ